MEKFLHDLILADESFRRKKELIDKAVREEIARNSFPIDPNVLDIPLSVSFPTQAGFSRYDIEMSDSRKPVGSVFGVENEQKLTRYGLINILLLKSPIVVVTKGTVVGPDRFEVLADGKLIGTVDAEAKAAKTFKLQSEEGGAAILLENNSVSVGNGRESFEFGLQLDLDHFPNPFSKAVNPNVVYQPSMRFCNALVVMSFLVALRMVYRRHDF